MIFGTSKALNVSLRCFISIIALNLLGITALKAQSDEQYARSYYLQAEEAYENGNNDECLDLLDKTLEHLDRTNPRVEALYVDASLANKDYVLAESHLKKYLEVADNEHVRYEDMLRLLPDVQKEADAIREIEEAERRKEEEKRKIRARYAEVGPYHEGLARVYGFNYRYGFINKNGDEVVEPQYAVAYNFHSGLAVVKDNSGRWGAINRQGVEVIKPQFAGLGQKFKMGRNWVAIYDPNWMYDEDQRFGYINKEGEVVIPAEYLKTNHFRSDGSAEVWTVQNDNFVRFRINRNGERVTKIEIMLSNVSEHMND